MIAPADVEGHFFQDVFSEDMSPIPVGEEFEFVTPQTNRAGLNKLFRDPAVDSASLVHGLLDGIGMTRVLNGDPGVRRTTGIPDLRTHNGLVIATFERFFSEGDLPYPADLLQFNVKVGFHDGIKPHAHEKGVQHLHKEHNADLMRPGMAKLGFPEDEIDLEVATVESDGLGMVTKLAAKGELKGANLLDAARIITNYAEAQQILGREDFFAYKLIYFICDSFSYTSVMNPYRPNYFPESAIARVYDMPRIQQSGDIHFTPAVAKAIDDLRDLVLAA